MIDIRCDNKKHGEIADGLLEFKCSSRFCGARSGVIVIHVFDTTTGTLVATRKFREVTPNPNKEVEHGR